jgi:predicted amidohydrolase
VGLLVSQNGILYKQGQTHSCGHLPWVTHLDDVISIYEASWGKVALLVGQDIIFPEMAKIATLKDADLLIVMTHILEDWETNLGLLSRFPQSSFPYFPTFPLPPFRFFSLFLL